VDFRAGHHAFGKKPLRVLLFDQQRLLKIYGHRFYRQMIADRACQRDVYIGDSSKRLAAILDRKPA
jgi:hypothetical protein